MKINIIINKKPNEGSDIFFKNKKSIESTKLKESITVGKF